MSVNAAGNLTRWLGQKTHWLRQNLWWLALVVVIAAVLLSFTPAAFYFWSYAGFKELLHDDAGLGESWSNVGAIFLSLGYAAAIPYAGRWFILGRSKRKIEAIVATIFILAITPTLHALFDTNFNQETGKAQKWYVWHPGGQLTFSDSSGYDPETGAAKRPVTPEIARILERQKRGIRAQEIQIDPMRGEFFDPVTGETKVWYVRDSSGHIHFFDDEGFSPADGTLLKPVTSDVVKQTLQEEAARRAAEEKAAQAAEEKVAKEIDAAKRFEQQQEEDARRQEQEQKLATARAAEERRLAQLGITLQWGSDYAGNPIIKVLSVSRNSPLASQLIAGDSILEIGHQSIRRGKDPRQLLNDALDNEGRLDLLIARNGVTYSVAYRTQR